MASAEERSPLRVGVAGTGFVGRIHAAAARAAGARLIGVAASTPERSREAAAALGADALDAGKRVICEKPLAPDAASAARLAEAAFTVGGGFVPFVYRYYPTVREARERVRAGAVGRVQMLHGTY